MELGYTKKKESLKMCLAATAGDIASIQCTIWSLKKFGLNLTIVNYIPWECYHVDMEPLLEQSSGRWECDSRFPCFFENEAYQTGYFHDESKEPSWINGSDGPTVVNIFFLFKRSARLWNKMKYALQSMVLGFDTAWSSNRLQISVTGFFE